MLKRAYDRLKQYRNIIFGILGIILVFFLLSLPASATGETLWGYIKALIIPVVIGLVAFWY